MATIDWMNTSRADVTGSLRFSDPKTTSNGMKVIDIAFNGTKLAVLQTPRLKAPFSASDKFEQGKFKLLLRLAPTKAGEPEQALVNQFMRMLKALDEAVIDHVFKNQETVLGVSGKSKELIADKHSPLVKLKEGREPALDLKFGIFSEVYNKDKQAKTIEDITPGSLNVALFKLNGIWANSKGFGVLAKCMQVMTTPGIQEKISGFAFVDMVE
tara:strand:+ start:4853 stop:5491 length:639 start_codon:yes stop_codon:yes gene_type:complete